MQARTKGSIKMQVGTVRDAGFETETKDCFVQALMHATGVPYRDAHAAAAEKFNRPTRKGTMVDGHMRHIVANKTTLFGYRVFVTSVPVGTTRRMSRWGNLDLKPVYPTLEQMVRRMRTGRYIVCSGSHAWAVIDGVVYDNGVTGPRTQVQQVYELIASSVIEAREQAARDAEAKHDADYDARMPVNNGGF